MHLIDEIQKAVDPSVSKQSAGWSPEERQSFVDDVARKNVLHTMHVVKERSTTLRKLVDEGKIKIVGCIYDISTGKIEVI